MSLAESSGQDTQLGRGGQGISGSAQKRKKVGNVEARILFMDVVGRLLIQSTGLVGIFKLKG